MRPHLLAPNSDAGPVWKHVIEEYPWLKLVGVSSSPALTLLLVYSCLFSTSFLWRYGGDALSYGLYSLNQFENAERVLKATSEPGSFSFAGWSGSSCKFYRNLAESENINIEIDNAVSRVYGPKSNQMICRLRAHGFNLESSFKNYVLSAQYFQKAVNLLHDGSDSERQLELLQFLAYAQLENRQLRGLESTVGTARALVLGKSLHRYEVVYLQEILGCANEAGIDVSAERLMLNRISIKKHTSVKQDFCLTDLVITWCLLNLGVILATKKALLIGVERCWLRSLGAATSVLETIEIHEKLIAL